MNLTEPKYTACNLVHDMLESADVIARFDPDQAIPTAVAIARIGRLLLTGEGSSRIFPAKYAINRARIKGDKLVLHTEGGVQARESDLSGWAVFAASNSGKTREVIELYEKLAAVSHPGCFSLAAYPDTRLQSLADKGYVLSCGKEGAVAATKSVMEQALFLQALLEHIAGRPTLKHQLPSLAAAVRQTLQLPVDPALTRKIAAAGTIYFAGDNDGVAEELTLKTNEITRKKSDFLEGTYAVHGVEEVMDASDVVIWLGPRPEHEEKFEQVLVKGVGLTLIAIADRPTRFPTLQVPSHEYAGFIRMAAGWNLLVEAGLALGVDLDKPQRARKVGNEYPG